MIEPWAIWDIKRLGALEPGFSEEVEGQDSAGRTFCKIEALADALVVAIGGQVQRLGITYTACGPLGRRPWWVCPVCRTRRGVIFLRSRIWGCRACMKLPYRSQRLSRLDRAIAKAKRLHIALGGSGSPTQDLPPKRPHGMRRRTYWQKYAQYSKAVKLCNELLRAAMEKMRGPLVEEEKS